MSLGIQSEIGRAGDLTYEGAVQAKARYDAFRNGEKLQFTNKAHEVYGSGDERLRALIGMKRMSGTSIFDPVLCELAYRWWCPLAGVIVDPFAGGSVRGVVASKLGYKYWGCDLRQEQVDANLAQIGPATCGRWRPKWVCGDSMMTLIDAPDADFLWTCPPYGDLEQYSEDPRDISTHEYGSFLEMFGTIMERAANRLRPDRFAAIVVANFRDRKTGLMRDLVGDTRRIFEKAALDFYNDAILINCVGTGAMRSNTNFVRGNRKLVKLHQNVLTFVKGDPARAAALCESMDDGKNE